MIFSVRQVQEKCIEQNMDLVTVFIDMTKAFDTVNRETIWVILSKLGCPAKFVNLIRQFHDYMTGQVISDGKASEPFSISNGVKQGCVLAPVLFNLFFTCVLNHATRDLEQGVYLRYRLEGSLFDLPRLTAKTKTVKKTVLEALFADECALMAHKESDLQIIVNKFAEASHLFGLTISLGKTEVLFQPAPAAVAHRPTISTDGAQLKTVDDFKYLGSVISSDGGLDKEISAGICKSSQALGFSFSFSFSSRMHRGAREGPYALCSQHSIRQSTKLKVYRAVVLTSLLHGRETWTMRSLRTILNIKWQDRVSNLQALDMAESNSIEAIILKSRLRWVVHVIRIEDNRLPKQLMFWKLASGKQKQDRPLKRFKDCVKASIT